MIVGKIARSLLAALFRTKMCAYNRVCTSLGVTYTVGKNWQKPHMHDVEWTVDKFRARRLSRVCVCMRLRAPEFAQIHMLAAEYENHMRLDACLQPSTCCEMVILLCRAYCEIEN